MTVIVAFHCSDGMVIAADSMITPSMGALQVGHHHGQKISVLDGPQLFAFAGDQGLAARFKVMANGSQAQIAAANIGLDYAINISASILSQFSKTGIQGNQVNLNTILAFAKDGEIQTCVFEGMLQPRFLDAAHYYVALGSGKLSADPFLRFISDVFCRNGEQPSVREAVFLATWTVQHVIDTNPGGVAGPIRVATFEKSTDGNFVARNLPDDEIDEHKQAIESAADALRHWRDQLQSGETDAEAPPQLMPPQA